MLVKNWMTTGAINLTEKNTVIHAADLMRRNGFRQLPVTTENGELVGIVSDRDIRDAMPSKFLPGDALSKETEGLVSLTIADIMTPDPLTIAPDATVELAAEMLLKHKVGGLPVVEDGKMIGIITEVDVFNYLGSVTGVQADGIQLVFMLDDNPGTAIDLLSRLKDEEVRLTSVLTSYENVESGYRHVSIIVQSSGKHSLETLIELLKKDYQLLYYVHKGQAVKA